MGRPVTRSLLEYDVLWEHLRLGPPRATAWASLAEKGLGRPEAPDGRLTGLLNRLARPVWQHRRATVAVLDDRGLTLHAVRADQAAQTAVSLLPPHPPSTDAAVIRQLDEMLTALPTATKARQ